LSTDICASIVERSISSSIHLPLAVKWHSINELHVVVHEWHVVHKWHAVHKWHVVHEGHAVVGGKRVGDLGSASRARRYKRVGDLWSASLARRYKGIGAVR